MTLFPHSSLPAPRIATSPIETAYSDNLIGPFDSGREVVLPKMRVALNKFDVTWARRCWDEFRPLVQFFHQMRGRTGVFTFIAWPGSGYAVSSRLGFERLYVATVNVSAIVYEMPFLQYDVSDADHLTVYLNDTAIVHGTDYTLEASGSGTGTDGRVKLTFLSLSTLLAGLSVSAALLTVSGRFAPAFWARFDNASIIRNPAVSYVIDVRTQIHEVRRQVVGSLVFG